MDASNEASSKWELSKENIQPLKQGRKAAVLAMALDEKSTQKLNVIRHEFEEELRTYSGDDPLDVWYRYALWVEQNYPKGGKEGNIMKLIEKCVTAIHSNINTDDKYKNDQRFLNLWIKYANLYPNPLDIYQAIEKKGLCIALAEFYINWSWELEKNGNYKQADNIYQKGLQMAAQPLHVLQEAHKKFQTRVVRSTLEGNAVNQDPENQRVALTALKPQGRNNRVAAERVGAAVIGPAGRVHQSPSKENAQGPGFLLFQDSSGSAGISSSKSSKGGSFGMGQRANQENMKAASHWSKAKVKQTAHVVPVEDVDKYQTPAFSLHEDDSVSHQTPAKLPQTSNVLSTRKKDFEDWQVELFIAEPFNPKVQPQYCKHKVYCGTEEFSFEELRAARFFKKEKEDRQKNEELLGIREQLKKQEEMIQLLLQHQRNNNEVKAVPQVTARSPSPPPVVRPACKLDHKTQNSSRNVFQDSWVAINKSVNVSNVFDESSTRALLHCMPEAPCISSKESSVIHDPSPQKAMGKRDEFSVSVNNNASRSLNMTDPTVETRKALNAMDDLFSLNFNYDTQQEPSDELQPTADSTSKEASPFSIFQDDGIKSDSDFKEDKSAPFQIFNDEPKEEEQSVPFQIFSDGPSLSEPPQLHELPKVNPAMEPKAVASKDLNDQYLDEQDENRDPAGSDVLGPRKTRPLMGVLQPSTVVPLPPVDHTDSRAGTEGATAIKDYENMIDGLEDIVPLDGTMGDFTLKMPTNLEAFAKHAKVASTPAPWAITLPEDYAVSDFGASEENHFPLIKDTEDGEDEKGNSGDLMPPPTLSSTCVPLAPHHNPTSPTPAPPSKVGLSPIFEGSREYITSSSSSSSGNSTTSTTLGGHSIYGATHMSRSRHYSNTQPEPGHETGIAAVADFTKSGYLADKSRGESIMDSKPSIIASQSEHQKEQEYFTFDTEAEAMMEKEIMLHPPLPPVHNTNNKEAKSGTPAFPENINPFCDDIIKLVLSSLKEPLERRGGYVALKTNLPPIKVKTQVSLGSELFHIRRVCGEGAYAVAYLASTMDPLNVTIMPTQEEDDENEDEEKQIILKTQNPACPWEFYICHELRERLKARAGSLQILDSVMRINRGYFSASQSVLVNQYHKYGTLLDAVNGYRTSGQSIPEMVAMYYMIEVLSILEVVHKCGIIHADVKPDNFLIRDIPKVSSEATTPSEVFSDCPNSLKLIDFGRSIDMEKFPEGTTFSEVVTTDKFTCCEMREGLPWTYQTDLYGAAAIAHLLLFGSYMEVKRNTAGKWNISGVTLKRYWKKDIWQELFSTLLNVSSCSAMPSLADLKGNLMATFCETQKHKEMNTTFSDLLLMLHKRRVK